MSSELEIRCVDWSEASADLRDIREKVFMVEQGIAPEIEIDGNDAEAHHFLGYLDGVPVASGRLLPDGKVSRMSVLPQYRGRHFGRQILEAIVAEARRLGLPRLYLHAQAHAAGFYRRSGFETEGEPFYEADIPHIAMRLEL